MSRIACCSALCFALGVAVHWLMLHLRRGLPFIVSGYAVWLSLALGALPVAWRVGASGLIGFYLTWVVLWNLYLVFFINLMNSVSLRMMIEIHGAPDRQLSRDDLLACYTDEEALHSRLEGLVRTGFAQWAGPSLVLTARGRSFAALLSVIRRLFGIEFYG